VVVYNGHIKIYTMQTFGKSLLGEPMSSQDDNMYAIHGKIITGIAFKFAEDIIQLRTPFSVEWRSSSFGIPCALWNSHTQHNKLGNVCIAQLMHPLCYYLQISKAGMVTFWDLL
jgi:hypothetical protein